MFFRVRNRLKSEVSFCGFGGVLNPCVPLWPSFLNKLFYSHLQEVLGDETIFVTTIVQMTWYDTFIKSVIISRTGVQSLLDYLKCYKVKTDFKDP